jgi:hypothetical protein
MGGTDNSVKQRSTVPQRRAPLLELVTAKTKMMIPILSTKFNGTPGEEADDVFPVHQDLRRPRHLVPVGPQEGMLSSP